MISRIYVFFNVDKHITSENCKPKLNMTFQPKFGSTKEMADGSLFLYLRKCRKKLEKIFNGRKKAGDE